MDSISHRIFEHMKNMGATLPETGPDASRKDYIEQGWLDSLGIVNLIAFVESEFGVAFTFEDMDSPAFRTVDGLAEMVRGHGGGE